MKELATKDVMEVALLVVVVLDVVIHVMHTAQDTVMAAVQEDVTVATDVQVVAGDATVVTADATVHALVDVLVDVLVHALDAQVVLVVVQALVLVALVLVQELILNNIRRIYKWMFQDHEF